MFRVLILCTTLVGLSFAVPAQAVVPDENSAVSKTFKKLGRSMRGMRDVSNNEELLEVLSQVRELAVENTENVPSFMQDDQAALEEYKAGMDEFISRIDAAIGAAESGDFDGAMDLMKNVRGAKNEFHEQFELEETH